MPKSTVSLVLRVNHPHGKRTHHTAIVAANGRIKPHYGVVAGKPTHLPGSSYYLRCRVGGRRIWQSVGADPAVALSKRNQKQHELAGLKLGLGPVPVATNQCEPSSADGQLRKPPLAFEQLVYRYTSETEMLHTHRTAKQYHRDLTEFGKVAGHPLPTDVTRQNVQAYVRHLLLRGMSPKTVQNRLITLRAFLRKHGATGNVVQRADAPVVHKTVPHAFTKGQVTALLGASCPEDRLIWEVFLAAGLREAELSHLGWEDVNFERNLLHLHAKPDLGFALKDREERQIPIPQDLVRRLAERRVIRPHDRLIFPTEGGKPNKHLLRRLKIASFKAGLNCGLCRNRAKMSCKGKAVCSKWKLHSFRRTAATRWHEAGMTVPTVQRLLGHSDVETTMRYLSGQDLSGIELRESVERCFARLTA